MEEANLWKLPFVKLIDTFEAQYIAIANVETLFTFFTNKIFGSVGGVFARRKDTTFLTPVTVFREIDVPGFNRTAFQVTQVFYPSKDGTKIPMFVVARKAFDLGFEPLSFGDLTSLLKLDLSNNLGRETTSRTWVFEESDTIGSEEEQILWWAIQQH
ncbi:Uncharacterized protein Rs2_01079 [Raphanus sativus]|nr:Uncharacterized protein Rs2_01079 [Raphanus sativus]